jgi:RHS repeat-associated protein
LRSAGGTSREEWRYLHADALGTPERTSNFAGEPVELVSFDPWGLVRSWNWGGDPNAPVGVPVDMNIGFTGHRIDYENGLIDAVGRTYNPAYKRFLTPDPFVQDLGDGAAFNRFAYVQNDPVGRIDPSGYQSISPYPIISVQSGGAESEAIGGVAGTLIGFFFSALFDSSNQSSIVPRATTRQLASEARTHRPIGWTQPPTMFDRLAMWQAWADGGACAACTWAELARC